METDSSPPYCYLEGRLGSLATARRLAALDPGNFDVAFTSGMKWSCFDLFPGVKSAVEPRGAVDGPAALSPLLDLVKACSFGAEHAVLVCGVRQYYVMC